MNTGPDYDRDREGTRAVSGEGSGELRHGTARVPTPIAESVRPLKVEYCRECRDLEPPVHTRAEFILWGKLFPAEAFGPKCYDHAAKHLGWQAMSRIDQYAVYDLRPINARFDGSRGGWDHGAMTCNEFLRIWDGDHEGACVLANGHVGWHWDGTFMAWLVNDDGTVDLDTNADDGPPRHFDGEADG